MESDFKEYQKYLGSIPEFLKPYLELNILKRLKDISLLCGMDYASKSAYNFAFYISRYDHSLNVALITWRLTNCKEATLAALFHDISTPVFSHVIDYMNGDTVNQESTEEKTEEILRNSKELKKLLKHDNIAIDDIVDFKKYSIVDLDRPLLCADRLDNIISVGMAWVKKIALSDALKIIDSISVVDNEFGVEEISINDEHIAEYLTLINDYINELTHTNTDTFMMILLADIIKRCITLNIFTYEDLFVMGEHTAIDLIEANLDMDFELASMWEKFRNISEFPIITQPPIRNKIINPLVVNKRLKKSNLL